MDSASEGMHAPDESIAREVADERGGNLDPPGALEPAACSLRKRRDGDGVVRMGLGSPLIGGVSLAGRGELAARHRESGHSRLAATASG
uniref:Uncharacterized protein n=1 Tax=Oryza nivara TaxID=4536 RepID=A0A0E0IZV5_ORYNI